ncbi:MAG: HzsA-related protein [Planctomycetota bacterium]|jgi:hypothetical protein
MKAILALLAVSVASRDALAVDITILAKDHSARSPHVVPVDDGYGGLVVCHSTVGMQQWNVEVRLAGNYYIHVCYASGQSRPVQITINGQRQNGDYLGRSTGGWRPEHLGWATLGPFALARGANTIRMDAPGSMPHLAGLVISPNARRWDRETLTKLFANAGRTTAKDAKDAKDAQEPKEQPKEDMPATRSALRETFGIDEVVFIKRYPYTANHYYTEYLNSRWMPGGGIFVLSLADGTERQIATELKGGIFGRMDISFDATRVVFDWKRSNGEGYRIYEVSIDGSGLRQVLEAPADEAEVVKKYRLGYHHGSDDMHPCYLPDGGFAFVSTRCRTSTLCHGGDVFTTTVVYRMDADGSNLRQLSFGALSEFTPTILPDGRIMYARWEYVDKGAVAAKCIWAMRPDGTASSEVYGNDIGFPTTMIQARAIPGAPGKYVILGCPHFPQNGLGTVVRLDMNQPIRTTDPITYITPYVKLLAEGGWHFIEGSTGRMRCDRKGSGPLFRDPYPLDEDHFLVAHKPRGFGTSYEKNGYGLYLLDSSGKVLAFHRDPEISCWQPIPLRPRREPPALSGAIDPGLAGRKMARCIVTDIYHGMEDVERGSIKHIRVLEQIPRPWSARRFRHMRAHDVYDQQHAVVSKDTALGLKVQHGVVPVEEDGSAHFLVPANANIFFQALDEDYLAVQTERTFVNFMPGEVRSCIGCHETPDDAPPTKLNTLASKRPPSLPGPQIGEETGRRVLHYPSDVQPVLDKHCIKCHDSEKKKGGLDLTGTMTTFFSASYENLLVERRGGRKDRKRPGLVPTIGENHPKTGNVHYLPARSLGSHNSLLMAMLMPEAIRLQGDKARMDRLRKLVEVHRERKLTRAELLRISNWVDTNAQYYGSYYGRRNIKDKGHPNFRPVPSWDSAVGIPPLPDDRR